MPNKVLKTIQIKWKWHGDLYLLKGFNICLMPSGKNPVDNPDRIIVFNKVLPNADIINNEYIFSYNFMNQPLDEGSTCVPWVQALYDNSDSQWASMGGQVIEDDGQATIVVVGNPTFQQIIDMADDDKITPQEKLQLQKEWEEVVAEHQQIEIGVIKADILNSQEVTEYVNAVQSLAQYLNYNLVYDFTSITNENFIYPSMLIDKLTTDLNTKHYNGKECYNLTWRTYYEARINILEKIRDQLFENNKAEIEDWLGQNNLPTTIETGGYISNKLTANINYDNKNTPGYIKVHFGTFITPTGVKFSIEGNKHIPTGLSSNKNGIVYLIFVGADTSRFSFSSKNDSQQFICATHNGKEWFYLHNGEEKRFKPNTEDCIVAKVEEFATDDNNNGIKAIKLFASNGESIFNALTDGGKSQGVYRDEETGLIYINAEFMKIGVIKSQNGKSEFDLNDGSFRLGGTEANDYRDYSLKFDGKDLHLGQGSIKWENLDETAKDHMQSISVNIIGGVRTISVNGKNQVLTTPTAYTASVKSGTTDITNNCTFNWKAVGIFSGNGNSISFTPIKSSYTEAETFIQLTIAYNSEIYEERIPISVSKAGLDGTNAITYYTWVKYADGPNGEGISSNPAGKEYIGIAYNKATSTPSNTPKDYAWSLIKGEDGIPGVNGIDGKTYYTWIKYADSPTSGMSDSPNGKLYMGIAYNRETKNESTNYNDYSWSLIKGADGQDGVNGKTYYTWIRYADSPTTGISSSPVGKMYIGIAYNKTTNTPSSNYNDYSWSLIKGKDGVPGTNGIDGKTYFTWIKYADTPTSGMSDNPDGKKYIGLAYNKTTSIESNSYNDYAWSLIKGKDGVDGVDGKDGKDGINAQYVLVAGEQTFKYTNNFSGVPSPTSITLTAIAIGYANPKYQWSYKTAGSTIVTNIANATNSTYILTHNNSIWGNNKQLTLRCTCGDHYDEMTIVKVSDGINGINGQDGAQGPAGKDAYTVILTNENHTFATDSNGNIPTALSTTTTVIAYKGAASITPAIGNITAPTGMNVTKSGAVITVTASTGTSLADTGTFNIPVTVDGRSFTKTFTWSKSKQGHTGPAGANGTSATAYWLISSASAIGKNTSNVYNPTSVTFTAKYQTGTSTVTNYNGRFIIAESTNGTDFTNKYTSSANEASKVWSPSSTSVKSIRVRLYQAGGFSVILDEQTIPIVTDGTNGTNGVNGTNGASAVTAVLSNESHNIPCNTAGTPTTYAGAVTTMSVFVGASDTSSSWTYTVQTTNISGTSSNNNRTYTVTGISADVGYVDLTASRNGYSSVTKRFTVVKAKQGATGAQGPAGSNGQDANLLDWVKEWNGTKTEIGGTKVITPKLFAGTVSNSKPTGVALGMNVLGTGANFSGLAGYKAGVKTYHLGTDGTLLIGASKDGNHISFDGNELSVKASKITIGASNVATNTDVNNAVNTGIDNLQIGGRNYVLKSDRYITENTNQNFDFSILQELRGKKITVSVEIELNKAVGSRVGFEPSIIYADGSVQYLGIWQSISSSTTMKKRISATHTIHDKEIKSYSQRGIYIQGVTSGTARVGRPKLEIGTKVTDWTAAPEDIDKKVGTLETWKTETEQKITDDAIMEVVKKSVYTKEETEDKITSKGYQTATEVKKAVEGLEVKVSESGGYNLLRNSTFKNNDIEEWWYWGGAKTYWNKNYFTQTGDMWFGIMDDSVGGLWQNHHELEPNTTYTFSVAIGWEFNVKETKFVIEYTPDYENNGAQIDSQHFGFQNDSSIRQSVTFTTPANIRYAKMGFWHGGSHADAGYLIHINKPCLTKGIGKVWTPNPIEALDKATSAKQTAEGFNQTITKTLSENYYKKTEIDSTIDGVKYQFTQSGGYNLLLNSQPNRDTTAGWNIREYNLQGPNLHRTFGIKNDEWTGYEPALELRIQDMTSGEYRMTQDIDTTVGQSYIFTGYIAGHRCNKSIYIRSEAANEWDITKWATYHSTIHGAGNGDDYSQWVKINIPFVAHRSKTSIEIMITNTDGSTDGCLWVKKLMVTPGTTVKPWSANPNEIYDGITTIDKDGIKVSMQDGEGSQGYTRIAHDGMEIFNSHGTRIAHFGDNESAYIKSLTAEQINNPLLLRWNRDRPHNLYVAPHATGDGTGRDPNNRASSIANTLNWLWKTHGCYSWQCDINIYLAGGDYWGADHYIGGWLGTGVICVIFDQWACIRSTILIEENTMPIIIRGSVDPYNIEVQDNAYLYMSGEATGIHVRNSHVVIAGLNLQKEGWYGDRNTWGNYQGYAVYANHGANVLITNCDIVGWWYGCKSSASSYVSILNCVGHVGCLGVAMDGGIISYDRALPISKDGFWRNTGGFLWNSGYTWDANSKFAYKADAPPEPPPAPPAPPPPPPEVWTWMENTFWAASLWTTTEGSGIATSAKTGKWGQGKWGSYKPHRGYASFSGIDTWCHGGRNFTMELIMTRENSKHGVAGSVPVPKIKTTNGSFWNSGRSFARGATHTITLPSDVASAFASGGWNRLEMWAGTSTNDYSFYHDVKIRVVCEKRTQ